MRGRAAGSSARRADTASEPERQVDQEHQAPPAEQVQRDERAAEDRADHRRRAHHRAEQAERLGNSSPGKTSRITPRPCGIIIAPARPWTMRAAIRTPVRRRQPAQRRRGGEAGRADQEHPPAAEQVAEPAAGQQPDRERHRVAADDPLQRVADAWRSWWIVGAATLTTVPSSRSMHSAARITNRISHRFGGGGSAECWHSWPVAIARPDSYWNCSSNRHVDPRTLIRERIVRRKSRTVFQNDVRSCQVGFDE